MTFPKHFAVSFCQCGPCLVEWFLLGLIALGEQVRRRKVSDGTTRRVTTAQIPKRGVSDCWSRESLAESRMAHSDPITSLGICVSLGASLQQCGKEVMWLQNEENEPG